MMNKGYVGGLLAVVVLLAGCATTSGMEATGKPMGDPKFAKHLVIHNEALAGKVIITDMLSRVSGGGLLQVNVVLTNLTSSDKDLQYRFSWYDADSFEVEQGSRAWNPITLHGNASASLQAVAPNASVKSYKVNVRELK
jgi:uncharacterized protein YcfL